MVEEPQHGPPVCAVLPAAADDEDARQQVALIQSLLVTAQHFFGGFGRLFGRVSDPRHPDYITYPLPAVLAVGVLLFVLRLGARRQVTLLVRQNGPSRAKFQALFDVATVPHGDTLEATFERLQVPEVQAVVTNTVETLIRSKVLYPYRLDTTAAARKSDISQSALAGLPAGAAGLIIVSTFVCYQCVALHVCLVEWRQLRQEAGAQAGLAARVTQREAELGRLRGLERRTRVVVSSDRTERQPSPLAQGGGDAVNRTALLASLKHQAGRFVEWVNRDLTALGEQLDAREQNLPAPKTDLERKTALLAATPTILPVRGLITAGYGYRRSPFTGAREFHEGLDIAAPDGTPILATADGIVFFAGPLGGYGNVVVLDHGHGFATFYGHNSTNRVWEGQRVHRGDIVAYVGTTGRTTGPHVHYVIYVRGKAANPLKYTGHLKRAVHG